MVFENEVLRRIYGPKESKGYREVCNVELHTL
jgi:hypothetical protein